MFQSQPGIGGLEEQVLDVLERRPDHPERAVVGVVGQLVVGFDRGDRHPVEREQQHEDEDRQRQVDDEDPPRQRVELLHADDVVDGRRGRAVGGERLVGDLGLARRARHQSPPPCCQLAALQAEEAEEDGGEQEGDHRHRDRRPLAELAAGDGALEGERRHQVGGVHRAAAGQHVDELEVGEGEEHREGHHHRDDRREQRQGDPPEALPRGGAVERRRLVQRLRDGLQPGEERDRDEGHAAPDVGGDHRPAGVPRLAEEVDRLRRSGPTSSARRR